MTAIYDAAQDLQTFDTPEWRQYVQQMTDIGEIQSCLPICCTRLQNLTERMREIFEGKGEIIDLMSICAIAQEPMLIFGRPGTAKSALVTKFAECLGVRRRDGEGEKICFEYLLNRYTEPDELLGPVIIPKLTAETPALERYHQGMLQDAYIVFLDEIFRANSAILNTLLSLINERSIYEGGVAHRAKALIVFGASNNPPAAEELLAFYERFPIRVQSRPMLNQAPARRHALLQKGWELERDKLAAAYDPVGYAEEQVACLTDLLLCNRAVMEMWGGPRLDSVLARDFIAVYEDAIHRLNRDARQLCNIDDRKFVKLYKIMRAKAMFERQAPPEVDDLTLLKHTWSHPDFREMLDQQIRDRIAARKSP